MSNQKKCKHADCRKRFTPKQWFQRFCSPACRLKAWRKKKQEVK